MKMLLSILLAGASSYAYDAKHEYRLQDPIAIQPEDQARVGREWRRLPAPTITEVNETGIVRFVVIPHLLAINNSPMVRYTREAAELVALEFSRNHKEIIGSSGLPPEADLIESAYQLWHAVRGARSLSLSGDVIKRYRQQSANQRVYFARGRLDQVNERYQVTELSKIANRRELSRLLDLNPTGSFLFCEGSLQVDAVRGLECRKMRVIGFEEVRPLPASEADRVLAQINRLQQLEKEVSAFCSDCGYQEFFDEWPNFKFRNDWGRGIEEARRAITDLLVYEDVNDEFQRHVEALMTAVSKIERTYQRARDFVRDRRYSQAEQVIHHHFCYGVTVPPKRCR